MLSTVKNLPRGANAKKYKISLANVIFLSFGFVGSVRRRGGKMWDDLPEDDKLSYKKKILGVVALSPLFDQKNTDGVTRICTPKLDSKYQEKAFQSAFGADPEDINNGSYDVSLVSKIDEHKKYLVGIKTFQYNKGEGKGKGKDKGKDKDENGDNGSFQKIAQFKRDAASMKAKCAPAEISENSSGKYESDEISKKNSKYYFDFAREISCERNKRIRSAKSNLRGTKLKESDDIESVYHVLLTLVENNQPKIMVGETSFDEIDINNIDPDIKCTTKNVPLNFIFKDGRHTYKYTDSDSQLQMYFGGPAGMSIKDRWEVRYYSVSDGPYYCIEEIYDYVYNPDRTVPKERPIPDKAERTRPSAIDYYTFNGSADRPASKVGQSAFVGQPVLERPVITETYDFPLIKNGKVELYSGLNAFYGLGSKISRADRTKKLKKLEEGYSDSIDAGILSAVIDKTGTFLFSEAKQKNDKIKKEELRNEILELVRQANNKKFAEDVERLVFRPMNEMYIPIQDAKNFHKNNPDFFTKGAGRLKEGTNKLLLGKEERKFHMVFEPSGDRFECFITQDCGKGIESCDSQEILGEWILRGVFQLGEHEPITAESLYSLAINGFRLYRTNADDDVHFEFIWNDSFCDGSVDDSDDASEE